MRKFYLILWTFIGLLFLIFSFLFSNRLRELSLRKEKEAIRKVVLPHLQEIQRVEEHISNLEGRFLNAFQKERINLRKVMETGGYTFYTDGSVYFITKGRKPSPSSSAKLSMFEKEKDSWPGILGIVFGEGEERYALVGKDALDYPELKVLLGNPHAFHPLYMVREKMGFFFIYDLERLLSPLKKLPYEHFITRGGKAIIGKPREGNLLEFPTAFSGIKIILPISMPHFLDFLPFMVLILILFGFFTILFQSMEFGRALCSLRRTVEGWFRGYIHAPERETSYRELNELSILIYEHLLEERASRREEIQEALRIIITALEAKDPANWGHSMNVSRIAEAISRELKLQEGVVERVRLASFLHDISNLFVPDVVFFKRTRLTDREYGFMRDGIIRVSELLSNIPSLREIVPIVRALRERYDGKGYPDGLVGDEIPIEARIISVAEAYDSMRRGRPYRGALSLEDVKRELMKERGRRWDPRVVDALLKIIDGLEQTRIYGERLYKGEDLKEYIQDILKERVDRIN